MKGNTDWNSLHSINKYHIFGAPVIVIHNLKVSIIQNFFLFLGDFQCERLLIKQLATYIIIDLQVEVERLVWIRNKHLSLSFFTFFQVQRHRNLLYKLHNALFCLNRATYCIRVKNERIYNPLEMTLSVIRKGYTVPVIHLNTACRFFERRLVWWTVNVVYQSKYLNEARGML